MPRVALPLRIVLLAAVAGVLFTGLYVLVRGGQSTSGRLVDPVRIPSGMGEISAKGPEDCRECHAREYEEWSRSRHAVAWTNPQLRAFAGLTLGIEDCIKCHAPMPVFISGLGELPRRRDEGRDSGVDCLTCHLAAGGIVGPKGNPDAPCRPAADERLSTSAVCSGCHRTIGLDWGESDLPGRRIHCSGCHMGEKGHAPPGGHAVEKLREAFVFSLKLEGGEVVAAVKNDGAGHNFPGERHFRILQIHVEVLDGMGETVGEYGRVIKNVSAIRSARRDAKIKRGNTATYRFPLPAGRGRVRAALMYKLYPSVLDVDALVLAERELEY